MTPRRDVDFLDIDQPVEHVKNYVRQKHSVFPLCQDHLNKVVGGVDGFTESGGQFSIQSDHGARQSSIYVQVYEGVALPATLKSNF